MAHEFESGFVVGEQAWHGLATLLQDPPNTVAEAIVEAGLNWEVESIPVYDGDSKRIEGWQALRRSSDRSILHVATDSYDILQNKEAFKFFDAFLQDGSAALESMGSLREGRTVFGCARIGDSVSIGTSSDETAPYLVLHTSHDGVLATGVMFTPVRTVCSNTLAAGISQATAVRKVRHSARQRGSAGIYHPRHRHRPTGLRCESPRTGAGWPRHRSVPIPSPNTSEQSSGLRRSSGRPQSSLKRLGLL